MTSSFAFAGTGQITIDDSVRGGLPCVGATHVPITTVLRHLGEGQSIEAIAASYPGLTPADVQLALQAASWVMQDPSIDWRVMALPAMLELQNELRAWTAAGSRAFGHLRESLGE